MAQLVGKLETEVEIKSSAVMFYNIFKSQMHMLPNISSDNVQHVELHEGDWETVGCVKNWNYTLDGQGGLSVKEKVEEIDDENMSVRFNVVDGELLKHYKSFKATIQVIDQKQELLGLNTTSLVKWTMDYEKLSEEIPDPHAYKDFAVKITKDVDAHLLNINIPTTTVTSTIL